MEVKAELLKPYLEEERIEFIIQYNDGYNYKIVETDEALQALGLTEEEEIALREEEFNKQFFFTSLGYVRRKVNMKDGTKKDFLSDMLLQVKAGMEAGRTVMLKVYKKPDFTHEMTDEYIVSLQEVKASTPQFIAECLDQSALDFYGEVPTQILSQE